MLSRKDIKENVKGYWEFFLWVHEGLSSILDDDGELLFFAKFLNKKSLKFYYNQMILH